MTPTAAGIPAHVTNRDVSSAQTVLDELRAVAAESTTAGGYALTARGVLARWAADLREAGYVEGVQVGRRQAGNLVREALEDEGL